MATVRGHVYNVYREILLVQKAKVQDKMCVCKLDKKESGSVYIDGYRKTMVHHHETKKYKFLPFWFLIFSQKENTRQVISKAHMYAVAVSVGLTLHIN